MIRQELVSTLLITILVTMADSALAKPSNDEKCQSIYKHFFGEYDACTGNGEIKDADQKYGKRFSKDSDEFKSMAQFVNDHPKRAAELQPSCRRCDYEGKTKEMSACLRRFNYLGFPASWQINTDLKIKEPQNFGPKRVACRNLNWAMCSILGLPCDEEDVIKPKEKGEKRASAAPGDSSSPTAESANTAPATEVTTPASSIPTRTVRSPRSSAPIDRRALKLISTETTPTMIAHQPKSDQTDPISPAPGEIREENSPDSLDSADLLNGGR